VVAIAIAVILCALSSRYISPRRRLTTSPLFARRVILVLIREVVPILIPIILRRVILPTYQVAEIELIISRGRIITRIRIPVLARVVVPGILPIVEVEVILLAVRTVESIGTIVFAISTGVVILNILLAVLGFFASAVLVFLLPVIAVHAFVILGVKVCEKVGEFVVVLCFFWLLGFVGFFEFLESVFDSVLVGIDGLSDISPGFTGLLHVKDLLVLLCRKFWPLALFIFLFLLRTFQLRDSGLDILGASFDCGADILHGLVPLGHRQYLLVLLLGELLGASLTALLAVFFLFLGLFLLSLLFGIGLRFVIFLLAGLIFLTLHKTISQHLKIQ